MSSDPKEQWTMPYGRSEEEWADLATATKEFLLERAALEHTTSYTELNAVLSRRTGWREFDFGQDGERAALGALLGQVAEDTAAELDGHLISALVQYLDVNDAGTGFYALARSRGLPVPTTADDRQVFWAMHVRAIYERCASSRTRPRRRADRE